MKPKSRERITHKQKIESESKQPNKLFKRIEMDKNEIFHCGATPSITHVIRRRDNSPEMVRLIDRGLKIWRSGVMRRRYDMNTKQLLYFLETVE